VNILLVDDNPGDVRLTQEALKEGNCNCDLSVAKDGFEALAFLRREGNFAKAPRPDLVLLDLNLPGKDGFEVLKEMREDPNLKRIAVIVLTLSDSDRDVTRAYELNANCYVTKPGQLDEIMSVMKMMVDYWLSIARLPSSWSTRDFAGR
jgi:CheY-like chemotaxis protein